jgi:hypothetical protein
MAGRRARQRLIFGVFGLIVGLEFGGITCLKDRRPGFRSPNDVVDADEDVVEAGDVAQ